MYLVMKLSLTNYVIRSFLVTEYHTLHVPTQFLRSTLRWFISDGVYDEDILESILQEMVMFMNVFFVPFTNLGQIMT